MPKIISVYLSGPMYKTKEESTVWRNEVKEQLALWEMQPGNGHLVQFSVLDPCSRWFDNKGYLFDNASWIVQIDKMEIEKAHVLIVNANEPGWGTPMEQYLAYQKGKLIIAFCNKEYPSIWVKAHSHVLRTSHINAAAFLTKHAHDIARTL